MLGKRSWEKWAWLRIWACLGQCVLGCGLGLLLCVAPSLAGPAEELVLLNWAEYMDKSLLAQFEQETGVHIREVFFQTEDERDGLLAQTSGVGFDVVVVQAKDIEAYARSGWLAPIEEEKIPNLAHIPNKWRTTYPETDRYAVPWQWGTFGIGYRKDLLKKEITSWMDFFRPIPEAKGRLLMLSDAMVMRTLAMKATGRSMNDFTDPSLKEAAGLLREQKPFVHTYGYLGLGEQSPLITGQYWMALLFNGDAVTLAKQNANIGFVIPKEGTLLWEDCFAILAASKRKDLAARFIHFLHQPQNAARLAEFTNYASVNDGVNPFLSAQHRGNMTIYPPQEVLDRSEFPKNPPPKVTRFFKNLQVQLMRKE
ncbi:MAG: spermidine/putrescine ABC transporter substrate-binding protein [Magnetococcales bacterium]|nr:spermidine/putrescine ABC transporter substrate-binding protein [Magnetococcales bacterium]MBF0323250.1 spermidine/putrescine ABC transporter substrate-binding protein [Magnetococcales bacterium]